MTVRELDITNTDRIAAIYTDAQAASDFPIGPHWSRDQIAAEIQTGLGGWTPACGVDSLSAFVLYRDLPDAFEITMLATAPSCRRQGTMTELIAALQKLAKLRSKAIWLEVHEENSAARKLYEKFGFSEVGRRPRYYSDGKAAILYNWS